ncbi:helix-turn-helix domain-containing protein [Bifidobacterium parmae]|uniref:The helix-turn-helix motif n=1 Tax=Bifidobacterium parmae TaxID=361854 RepID=A0A2N5IWI6_9BIFI|nr:helix-turn-helix transcriptional regulator [Bifidobacterium parmae]PLS26319.1 the helix-turn-helix motif [Bifidobacterium parmae]
MGLRELRQKRGLDIQTLADKAGMDRAQLSRYENGKKPLRNMTLGTALDLCDALRVANPRKLLEDTSPKENTDDSQV